MLHKLCCSYLRYVFSYALHWNVPGCPHSVPATFSMPRPTRFISLRYRIFLPDCFSLWEQFLCSAAVLFGCSQKFSCRLGATKSASGLSAVAFGSLPSQNHANLLLARSQNHGKLPLASSYLPICLPVCPHGTARLPLEKFSIKFDI
jgi:hypothetical protein